MDNKRNETFYRIEIGPPNPIHFYVKAEDKASVLRYLEKLPKGMSKESLCIQEIQVTNLSELYLY